MYVCPLRTFLARAAHDAIAHNGGSPVVNYSTKISMHLSDLLHSLTRERDRQRTALSRPHYKLHHNIFVQLSFPHARHEAHDVHAYTYLVYCLFLLHT